MPFPCPLALQQSYLSSCLPDSYATSSHGTSGLEDLALEHSSRVSCQHDGHWTSTEWRATRRLVNIITTAKKLTRVISLHAFLHSVQQYHAKGEPFITKVFGQDYWVMPPKYLDDLKTAKAQDLSFFQALSDVRILPVNATLVTRELT